MLHLFLLWAWGLYPRGGAQNQFLFLGSFACLCVKDVCSVIVNGVFVIFELLGDDAFDGLNLLLVLHALLSIEDITRWSLKDCLAAVNDAKGAAVDFLLELLGRPVSTALDGAAETAFGLGWAEGIQVFMRLVLVFATEGTVPAGVAHGFLLLVAAPQAGGIALVVSVSEVESADNSDILALLLILPLGVKTLTFCIVREAIDCGNHPFR